MEMKKLYDRKEVPNSREGDNLSFIQIVVNELIFKIAIYYSQIGHGSRLIMLQKSSYFYY